MTILLASAVIAALVSPLFPVLTTERTIAAANVIQERTDWRNKIRGLALDVHRAFVAADSAKLNDLRTQFSLNVNPDDDRDQQLLQLIHVNHTAQADEFTLRVALLLKHDWERAKREASIWRLLLTRQARRADFDRDAFEKHKVQPKHNYRVLRIGLMVVIVVVGLLCLAIYRCTHFFSYLCQLLFGAF
jgi:hypothetical protein